MTNDASASVIVREVGRTKKEYDVQKPIIERAYELAKSGSCKDVREIERHLKAEGYRGFYADMAGPALRKTLRNLCLGSGASESAHVLRNRAGELALPC